MAKGPRRPEGVRDVMGMWEGGGRITEAGQRGHRWVIVSSKCQGGHGGPSIARRVEGGGSAGPGAS